MERTRIVDVFDDFTAEKFVDAVELAVNNFSFDVRGTVQDLMKMSDGKQVMLQDAIDSCIFALAHTDRIDGRNEVAAQVCQKLVSDEDPMPDVGSHFLRVHPTLQQSAMRLFCCYLDKAGMPEYQETVETLRREVGPEWFRFPLI